MTTGATRAHPSRRSRRRPLIVSAIIVVVTLVVGVIAADRIVDFTTERRIAEGLENYGDAQVDVRGFPILNQLAAGRLDAVDVTATRATYEDLEVTDVDLSLFDVPTDSTRPIGTVDGEATIPLSTIDRLAGQNASLPDGMTFTTTDGTLYLTGSLLGQDVRVGIDAQPDGRQILVSATTLTLGSAEVDLSTMPSFLTSEISDIVIDLGDMPEGLEVTGIDAVDDGMRVSVHGNGVMLE